VRSGQARSRVQHRARIGFVGEISDGIIRVRLRIIPARKPRAGGRGETIQAVVIIRHGLGCGRDRGVCNSREISNRVIGVGN